MQSADRGRLAGDAGERRISAESAGRVPRLGAPHGAIILTNQDSIYGRSTDDIVDNVDNVKTTHLRSDAPTTSRRGNVNIVNNVRVSKTSLSPPHIGSAIERHAIFEALLGTGSGGARNQRCRPRPVVAHRVAGIGPCRRASSSRAPGRSISITTMPEACPVRAPRFHKTVPPNQRCILAGLVVEKPARSR
jgi:hypothetical protein